MKLLSENNEAMKIVSLCYIFTTHFFTAGGAGLDCRNSDNHPVCCFHLEENNGTCVECNNGYTSRNGVPCFPCRDETFGFRCLQTCHCSHLERCNHVNGCQTEEVNSTTDMSSPDKNLDSNTNGPTSFSVDEFYSHSTKPVYRDTKEFISTKDIIVYTLSVTTIGFVIIVCNVIRKCRKRVTENRTSADNIIGSQEHERDNPVMNDYLTVYEEIDDKNITVDNGGNTENKREIEVDMTNDDYIDPCHTPEIEPNDGTNISFLCGDNKTKAEPVRNEVNLVPSQCDGHKMPYESLVGSSRRDFHEYEVSISLNKETKLAVDTLSLPCSSSPSSYVDVLMRSDSDQSSQIFIPQDFQLKS